MTTVGWIQLWIGVFFVSIFIAFFMYAFFKNPILTQSQEKIFHFLTALCAGFSGALFTGTALLAIQIPIVEDGSIVIQATAGIALFIITYLNFNKLFGNFLSSGFNFSIPENNTFRDVSDSLVAAANSVAVFVGFTEAELSTPIAPRQIHSKSIEEAILSLRHLALPPNIREYEVTKGQNGYEMRIKEK
jgi:hypothetical protein